MKNKGVLISLAVIFVIGILITKGTHNFVQSNSSGADTAFQLTAETMAAITQEEEAAGETDAATAMDMEPAMARGAVPQDMEDGEEFPGGAAPLMDEVLTETEAVQAFTAGGAADTAEDSKLQGRSVSRSVPQAPQEEKKVETEMVIASISPLDPPAADSAGEMADGEAGAEQNAEQNAAVLVESQSYYIKRFQDLDNQIQKSRDTQDIANVSNSARSNASNELKLWDGELNSIYSAILDNLSEERSQELVEEQRAWLKERDSTAMEAVKNSSGGSSDSLEYTVSLTESTRARAYELAEEYEAVLTE